MILRAGLTFAPPLVLALALAACAGDDAETQATAGVTGAATGAGWGAGGVPSTAETLIEADWSLDPGTEAYQCTRLTLDEDVYVTDFYPVVPVGTHHAVVTLDSSASPDGTKICDDPVEGGARMVYGAGFGGAPMSLPEGTAIKIAAGQQILLNLHLFNTGTVALGGTSGIKVTKVTKDEVVNVAEVQIFGKVDGLTVPPAMKSTQSASCVIASDVEVVIVEPHMHTLGRYMKAKLAPVGGGDPVALFDAPYSFDMRVHKLLAPKQLLRVGDVLTVACTYDNPGAAEVTFGESSADEMCYLGMVLYPSNLGLCSLIK